MSNQEKGRSGGGCGGCLIWVLMALLFLWFIEDGGHELLNRFSQEELKVGNYDGYSFSQLDSENDQIIYTAMQKCFENMDESIEVKAEVNQFYTQRVGEVLEAVLADYPEYFFVETCSIQSVSRQGRIIIEPTYTCTKEEAEARRQEIDGIVEPVCSSLTGLSDYEKVKGVYDFLIDRTVYDLNYTGTSIYELFHDGRAVCEGYARATQYMLNRLDVETLYVAGWGSSDLSIYGGRIWDMHGIS